MPRFEQRRSAPVTRGSRDVVHQLGGVRLTEALAVGRNDDVHVDRRIAALAGRQHGVVARGQLVALGLGRGGITHRLERGALIALHRGVYAVGHAAIGPHGAAAAAVLAAGPGAVVSHRLASNMWGLGSPPAVPEVTVVGRRPRSRDGLLVHHTAVLAPADVRVVEGLPVTAPARTLVDLAAVEPADVLEALLAEAQVLGLATPAAVRAAMARVTERRGLGLLRRLLEAGPAPTRSELERAMLRLVSRAGLPRPLVNTVIGGYVVDFAWPSQRLVVETDGWAAHGHRRAFERDRARDIDLQASGWAVVRITWRQLVEEPLRVAARLGQLLTVRA